MRPRRRLPLTALAASAVLVLSAPTALAGPDDALCDADAVRGPVPADFLVDACVDGTSVVLRNDIDRPVVVTAEGTGDPARTRTVSGPRSEVVRRLAGTGTTLLPGDVVRWPLGDGPARLTIAEAGSRIAVAVVADMGPLLPREGTQAERDAYYEVAARLVSDLVAVVEERAACVEGRNWLGTAGCDVATAEQVGRAVSAVLPEDQLDGALSIALDRASWGRWGQSEGAPADGSRVLVQEPVPGWDPPAPPSDGAAPQPVVRTVAGPGGGPPQAVAPPGPATGGGAGDPASHPRPVAAPRPAAAPRPVARPGPVARPEPVVRPRPVERPREVTPPVAAPEKPGKVEPGKVKPGKAKQAKAKGGKAKGGKAKGGKAKGKASKGGKAKAGKRGSRGR